MSKKLDRRDFIKNSILASTAALGLSAEHQALLAGPQKPRFLGEPVKGLPKIKLGNLEVSRLTCGGNLISGHAHSRDLIYVSSLLRAYFTDEKILETFQICEENGINTAVLRTDEDTVRFLKKYWKQGGKIQWIAQTYPKEVNLKTNIQMAIDNGAVGAFSQGFTGDAFFENGHVDLLGKVVDFIKEKGLVAGIGSHLLDVPMACEEAGIKPDFYMKTFNRVNYLCDEPDKVAEFMRKTKAKWIAFKVLGAGVTYPREGFADAIKNGADILNVGMYDFQIKEDAALAKELFTKEVCKDDKNSKTKIVRGEKNCTTCHSSLGDNHSDLKLK